MDDVRRRMIGGAARLLAEKGYQGTSFAGVIDRTGAPRGSIYHHFPGGKNELVAEALRASGEAAMDRLASLSGASVADVARGFIGLWRTLLVATDLSAGCAVAAVTIANESDALTQQAGAIFSSWRARLAELFEGSGVSPTDAANFAAMIVASCEGAVVMSRAEQSLEPFDAAAAALVAAAERLTM